MPASISQHFLWLTICFIVHFKSCALYIPAMGTLGDLRFTPLSDRLPIEVFISIIEHEASDRNLTDLETVNMAIRHLDTKAISSSHFKTGMLSIPHFSMQFNDTESWVHNCPNYGAKLGQ